MLATGYSRLGFGHEQYSPFRSLQGPLGPMRTWCMWLGFRLRLDREHSDLDLNHQIIRSEVVRSRRLLVNFRVARD